jgi:hypothetical protein
VEVSLSVLHEQIQDPETSIGGLVRIAYTNSYGQSSIRVIEPRRIFRGGNGYTYIRAWCHLRAEERTFRLDRVRVWDLIGTALGRGSNYTKERIAVPQPQKQPISSVRTSGIRTLHARQPCCTWALPGPWTT